MVPVQQPAPPDVCVGTTPLPQPRFGSTKDQVTVPRQAVPSGQGGPLDHPLAVVIEATGPAARLRRPLAVRDYLLVWAAQLISELATGRPGWR